MRSVFTKSSVFANKSTFVATTIGAAVLVIGVSGCTPTDAPPATSPTGLPTSVSSTPPPAAKENSAAVIDYSRLLIEPTDINSAFDTFVTRSTVPNRRGGKGVSALFVNEADTRAIGVTITVLPDPAAAKAALDASLHAIGGSVAGGQPAPSVVGTDGTVVTGTSPDGAKEVTALLFTEGPAVTRMEFQSAPGDPTALDVVNDIGIKQAIALRAGLPSVTD
ncbi:hypothetical protein [Mycolicibacterium baixiangningiae]|uniref:hypothetical protein n=1 Tax=Mycolicibacterium baixiangningiae TaxID=2761578 RepID=UPI001E420856|nr:hypothetical protein [Mycolicibacterium baixiangningiae]